MNRTLQQYQAAQVDYPADLTALPKFRGELNNNPTNLDWANIPWAGLDPTLTRQMKERFGIFLRKATDGGVELDGCVWGIRAAIVNMRTHERYAGGKITLAKLIHIWAPPNENDTGAYVGRVSNATGIAPNDVVSLRSRTVLLKFLRAIIIVECTRCIYPDRVLEEAIDLADGVTAQRRVNAGDNNRRPSKAAPSRTLQGLGTAAAGTVGSIATAVVEKAAAPSPTATPPTVPATPGIGHNQPPPDPMPAPGTSIVDVAKEALPQLDIISYYSGVLFWIALALVVGGIAFAAWRVARDKNPSEV